MQPKWLEFQFLDVAQTTLEKGLAATPKLLDPVPPEHRPCIGI
jgi:hypothetical protein